MVKIAAQFNNFQHWRFDEMQDFVKIKIDPADLQENQKSQ